MENLDFLDAALECVELDVVAHLVGLEQQDQHAAGKVLQRAAQRHAHGDARRGEDGDERTRLDAQHPNHRDDEDEGEGEPEGAQQEGDQRRVHVARQHHGANEAVELLDDEVAHVEKGNGGHDAQAQVDERLRQVLYDAVPVKGLQLFGQFVGLQLDGRNAIRGVDDGGDVGCHDEKGVRTIGRCFR